MVYFINKKNDINQQDNENTKKYLTKSTPNLLPTVNTKTPVESKACQSEGKIRIIHRN